jgi:hypothetical protein
MTAQKHRALAKFSAAEVCLTGVALCGFLTLVGCGSSSKGKAGGGINTGVTPLATGGASDVYVIQTSSTGTGSSILDFAPSTSGSGTLKGTLVVDPTFVVQSVASDSAGKIYVGGYYPSQAVGPAFISVLIYAAGATGSATPVQTVGDILTPASAMAVDSAGNIYLASNGVVEKVMPNNTATFLTTTSFRFVTGLAVDDAGNIYVSALANGQTSLGGSVQVFAADSPESASPVRTITTSGVPYGVALDEAGNIYTTVDVETSLGAPSVEGEGSIVEYAGGTTGSATPLKTVTVTGSSALSGVQVDTVGNLYLMNLTVSASGSSPVDPQVLGFAGSVTGSVEPAVTLSSSSWTYSGGAIAVH